MWMIGWLILYHVYGATQHNLKQKQWLLYERISLNMLTSLTAYIQIFWLVNSIFFHDLNQYRYKHNKQVNFQVSVGFTFFFH